MKLRNGKTIQKEGEKACGHMCELRHFSHMCCACSDLRPLEKEYYAHDQSYVDQVSIVKRNHRYCPSCKFYNNKKVADVLPILNVEVPKPTEHDVEQLKKKIDDQKDEIEQLKKRIEKNESKKKQREK